VRTILLSLALLLLAAGPAAALDVDEIRDLLAAGVDEEILREQIAADGSSFRLDAADLMELHKAGASTEFLRFLIRTRPDPDPEAAPAEPPEPETGPADRLEPLSDAEIAAELSRRIYRKMGDDGRVVIVFTNLDEDGNPLPESHIETSFIRLTSRDGGEAEGDETAAWESEEAAGPLIQVVVNPPAPAPEPEPVLAPLPWPYRTAFPAYYAAPTGFIDFPDQIPFLGYTLDNQYPKTFTGFGMPLFNDFTQKSKSGKTRVRDGGS
jgi:hypothetical protein